VLLDRLVISKLQNKAIWKRILLERLTEPLHLNIASVFIGLFGSWRAKRAFDLVLRPHNAYGIFDAAARCKRLGIRKLAVCEFGVANGAGLMNMARIAEPVMADTGVDIKVFGFDTGKGMPPPIDYRDHPDHYSTGDFQMDTRLTANLPLNTQILLGPIKETLPGFLAMVEQAGYMIGYVVLDVDYYSSTCDALAVFDGKPTIYLPLVNVYIDDVDEAEHNPSAGALLAVSEFNARSPLRKIHYDEFLVTRRLFSRAKWIKHMWCLHVFDHPDRLIQKAGRRDLDNPYLRRQNPRVDSRREPEIIAVDEAPSISQAVTPSGHGDQSAL
jgi:hypothetical protein